MVVLSDDEVALLKAILIAVRGIKNRDGNRWIARRAVCLDKAMA